MEMAVVERVAEVTEWPVDELLGHCRKPARARQVAMWVLRYEWGLSLPDIARLLNRADHTTVLYGVRQIDTLIESGDIDTLALMQKVHEALDA